MPFLSNHQALEQNKQIDISSPTETIMSSDVDQAEMSTFNSIKEESGDVIKEENTSQNISVSDDESPEKDTYQRNQAVSEHPDTDVTMDRGPSWRERTEDTELLNTSGITCIKATESPSVTENNSELPIDQGNIDDGKLLDHQPNLEYRDSESGKKAEASEDEVDSEEPEEDSDIPEWKEENSRTKENTNNLSGDLVFKDESMSVEMNHSQSSDGVGNKSVEKNIMKDNEIFDNEVEEGAVRAVDLKEEMSDQVEEGEIRKGVKRGAQGIVVGERNLRSRRSQAYKRIRASIIDLEDDNYEDNYDRDAEDDPEFDPNDPEEPGLKKVQDLNASSDEDEETFEPCVIVVNRKVFTMFNDLMEELDLNGSTLLKSLLQNHYSNKSGQPSARGRKRQRKSANPKPIRAGKLGRPRAPKPYIKYSDEEAEEENTMVNGDDNVGEAPIKPPARGKTRVALKRGKRKYTKKHSKNSYNSMKVWGIPEGDPDNYTAVVGPFTDMGVASLAFTFVDKDGVRKVKCRVCGKESARKWHTMEHLRTHTGERPHQCDQCPAAFKQLHHLREHKKTHTEDRPFSCHICFKCFRSDDKLQTHIQRHATGCIGKEKALNPNAKVYSCSCCPYVTTVRSDLIKHEVKHGEKIYKCEYCDFKTAWKKNLKDHMIRHTGAMPYACDCCDFKTNDRHALRTHKIKANHRQEFVCEVCGAIFEKQKLLTNHMIEHTGEKPYKCEHCDYSTRFRSGLRAHRLIHSTYRGYVCELCGKEFRQRGHLVCHQRNMHANPDGKSYICPQCGYSAATSQSFNSHMRKHKPKLKPGETRPPSYVPKAPGTNRGRPRKVRNADGSRIVVRDKDKLAEFIPETTYTMPVGMPSTTQPLDSRSPAPGLEAGEPVIGVSMAHIMMPQAPSAVSVPTTSQGITDPILIVAARAMEELQGQQATSHPQRVKEMVLRDNEGMVGRDPGRNLGSREESPHHSVINLTPVPVDATVSRGNPHHSDLTVLYTQPPLPGTADRHLEQDRHPHNSSHEPTANHPQPHSHMDMRYMTPLPQANMEREQMTAPRMLGHMEHQQGMMYGMMGAQSMHGMTALMAGLAAMTDYSGQNQQDRQTVPSPYPQYHPHQHQQHHHQQQ